MKPTTYINWDGLKDIPFFYCDTKEDEENKDFDIYYQGKLVSVSYTHLDVYKRQIIAMRTREDCKIGKVDGRNPVCPGFRLRGSFLAVTPKKNQKNASRTIGCDIVKYAKTWLFRINTYLRAKGDRNECIFYF